MKTETAQYIEDLARKNKVSYQETKLDVLAKDITRLSGDDVSLDHTELLLVALKRAGVLSGRAMISLQVKYINEVKNDQDLKPDRTSKDILHDQ